MEEHRRTSFSERGLTIHAPGRDREIDLVSGAMHYWRVPRDSWAACLEATRSLGLGVVETYVPWSIHETAPGRYDWSGERDLGAFLEAVAAAGMLAILRPGPHINAELTLFGFPERIVAEPEIQARTARGDPAWLPAPPRMFPVPSYASTRFIAEASSWLGEVARVVAPHLAPSGPVIAVQVDNEAQMFFRAGAFDHDYHPDALVWWHDFLGEPIEPPRAWSPDEAGLCARWVAFKDCYVARALTWMSDALREGGLEGLALFHNLPPTDPLHVDLPNSEEAIDGVVGLDFYHNASDYDRYHRRAVYLAANARTLPYAPELGVGGPPWLLPMTEPSQRNVILGVLSAGVRAFNLYMTVDRERWYGAPIDSDGQLREPATWIQRLLEILQEVGWTRLRRHAPVALILSRAEARFATASSVVDPITPVLTELLDLGPAGAGELARDRSAASQRRWTRAVESALTLAQIPYDLLDERAPPKALESYEAVIVPTVERVDRQLWRRLRSLRGSTRVICGPGQPQRDEYDRELGVDAPLPRGAGLIRKESMDDLEGLADDLLTVAGDLCEYWIADENASVDCSIFEDRRGEPRVLFVANRQDEDVTAEIIVPTEARLIDLFGGDEIACASGDEEQFVSLALEPYQIRMFAVDLGAESPASGPAMG